MEVITKQIETNRVGRRLTDQFMLDEDFNVPDSKNDVEKIVMSEGCVKIDEVKPVENYLRIQGKVEFQVLYVAEGFEPTFSCMEGKIPFVEMVYVEEGADKNLDIKSVRVKFTGNKTRELIPENSESRLWWNLSWNQNNKMWKRYQQMWKVMETSLKSKKR